MPAAEVERRVEEVLGFIGLGDYIDRMPSELSGGQRRRVAIARAMAAKPHLLLFDDPTIGPRSDHRDHGRRRDRQAARPGARDVDRRDAPDPRRVLRGDARGGAAPAAAVEIRTASAAEAAHADVHGAARRTDLRSRAAAAQLLASTRSLPAGVPVHDAAALVAASPSLSWIISPVWVAMQANPARALLGLGAALSDHVDTVDDATDESRCRCRPTPRRKRASTGCSRLRRRRSSPQQRRPGRFAGLGS